MSVLHRYEIFIVVLISLSREKSRKSKKSGGILFPGAPEPRRCRPCPPGSSFHEGPVDWVGFGPTSRHRPPAGWTCSECDGQSPVSLVGVPLSLQRESGVERGGGEREQHRTHGTNQRPLCSSLLGTKRFDDPNAVSDLLETLCAPLTDPASLYELPEQDTSAAPDP